MIARITSANVRVGSFATDELCAHYAYDVWRVFQSERKPKQWFSYTVVALVRRQQNARGGGPVPPP